MVGDVYSRKNRTPHGEIKIIEEHLLKRIWNTLCSNCEAMIAMRRHQTRKLIFHDVTSSCQHVCVCVLPKVIYYILSPQNDNMSSTRQNVDFA